MRNDLTQKYMPTIEINYKICPVDIFDDHNKSIELSTNNKNNIFKNNVDNFTEYTRQFLGDVKRCCIYTCTK